MHALMSYLGRATISSSRARYPRSGQSLSAQQVGLQQDHAAVANSFTRRVFIVDTSGLTYIWTDSNGTLSCGERATELSYAERIAMGRQLHVAFCAGNWNAIRPMLADDISWVLPGDHRMSGEILGVDQVVARVRRILAIGVRVGLERILVSRDNFALSLRITARCGQLILDERIFLACRLAGSRIRSMEIYINDAEDLNNCFD